MATYTVNTSINFDTLTSPAGADTYNISAGATLTIDTDCRYCNNRTAATGPLGDVTISSTTGGKLKIDGTSVRLIPYSTTGSGNVPAVNTTISQGGVSAVLLGVWSALNAAPTAAGAAMPASGFIKVKNKTGGNFTVAGGALTGIGATPSATDVVGWIEVAGTDAKKLTVPRQGTLEITGAWFNPISTAGVVTTTSGASNQTVQLPAPLASTYYAGVQIETSAGSGVYEWYPCAGAATSTGTESGRGKVVWISSQGLLRIGNSGAATNGYTPASGCNIRVPNIIFTTSAGAGTNNTPSNTLTTRYTTVTTGGGVISISKSQWSWFCGLDGAVAVTIADSAFNDQLKITTSAAALTVATSCVGITNSATSQFAILLQNNSGSTAITDCVFNSSSGAVPHILQASNNVTFTRVIFRCSVLRTGQTNGGVTLQNTTNTTFASCTVIGGGIFLTPAINTTITNLVYVDNITGSTNSTNPTNAVTGTNKTDTVLVDGITFGVTDTNPYTSIFRVNVCSNVRVRNIGTASSKMSMGTAPNACGAVVDYFSSGENVKIQRVYVSSPRTGLYSLSGSLHPIGVTHENVWGDAATNLGDTGADNVVIKGNYGGSGGPVSFSAASYGAHFYDAFNSNTVGFIGLFFNEPTTATTAYVDVTHMTQGNGSGFTSTGALQLVNLNEYVTWEWPHYILGYTSLANVAPTTAGTNISNLTLSFDIDKNDGNGFSGSYSTLNATNLSAVTGISATLGFKLRIKATCNSASSTNSINKLYIQGTTDSSSQQTQYPLDVYTLTLTGLVSGSDVTILTAGTTTQLAFKDNYASTSYAYEYYASETVDIFIIKNGYVPLYIRNLSLTTASSTLPVQQFVDRTYENP